MNAKSRIAGPVIMIAALFYLGFSGHTPASPALERFQANVQAAIDDAWEKLYRQQLEDVRRIITSLMNREDVKKQVTELNETFEAALMINKASSNFVGRKVDPENCRLIAKMEEEIRQHPKLPNPYKKNVAEWKIRAGGCVEPLECLPSELNPKIREIRELIDQGKCAVAKTKLNELESLCRNNKELQSLESEIADCKPAKPEPPKPPPPSPVDPAKQAKETMYNQLCMEAQQALGKGRLQEALARAKEAQKIMPQDLKASTILRNIENEITIADFGVAVEAFYAGDYARARDQLAAFTTGKYSDRMKAWAHFYMGAANGSEYLLAPVRDENKRIEAVGHFKEAFRYWGTPKPPEWTQLSVSISPKVLSLYDSSSENIK